MGDDLVWISKNLRIIRYPRRIHLFSYVINNSKGLFLSRKLKLILKLKDMLRQIIEFVLRERFHVATRVEIQTIIPDVSISISAVLENFIYMLKETDQGIAVIEPSDISSYLSGISEANEPMSNLFRNFFHNVGQLKHSVYENQKRMLLCIMGQVNTLVINRELVKTDIKELEKYLHA